MLVSEDTACRVFDVQRFSIHDGPGIRTTVFLEGCPLRCGWCHNPESFLKGVATRMSAEEIIAEDPPTDDDAEAGDTDKPVKKAAPEEAKRHGLHTCVQTSGAVPRAHFAAVLGLVDLFQIDLKHMDTQRHRELTGAGTERIHDNAVFLIEEGAPVQFRMPLLPGVNDDDKNLDRLAAFLRGHGVRELCLVPYHDLYRDKYAALGIEPGLTPLKLPSADDVQRVVRRMQQDAVIVSMEG